MSTVQSQKLVISFLLTVLVSSAISLSIVPAMPARSSILLVVVLPSTFSLSSSCCWCSCTEINIPIIFLVVTVHFLQNQRMDGTSSCLAKKSYMSSLTFSHLLWCQKPHASHLRLSWDARTFFPQSTQVSRSAAGISVLLTALRPLVDGILVQSDDAWRNIIKMIVPLRHGTSCGKKI